MRVKIRFALILIFIFAIATISYQSIGNTSQNTNAPDLPESASGQAKEVILEKVKEVKLDEEIVDIAVEHEKVKKVVAKNGKKEIVEEDVLYPKVVVTKKAVNFLDRNGATKKEFPLRQPKYRGEIMFSKNKKFIAVVDGYSCDEKECGHNPDYKPFKNTVTLIDDDGNEVFTKTEHNKKMSAYVSPNGKYFISSGGDPDVDFSNAFYRKDMKIELDDIGQIFGNDIIFSDDGKYFFAPGPAGVHMFDEYGKEVWRGEVDGGCGTMTLSKDMSLIAAICSVPTPKSISSGVTVFRVGGKMLWHQSIDYAGFAMNFSDDNAMLVVTRNFGEVYCYDVTSGKLLWKYVFPTNWELDREPPNLGIGGVFASTNLILVIGALDGYNEHELVTLSSHLYGFDKYGKYKWHSRYDGDFIRWENKMPSYPEVQVISNGMILMHTKSGAVILNIPTTKE